MDSGRVVWRILRPDYYGLYESLFKCIPSYDLLLHNCEIVHYILKTGNGYSQAMVIKFWVTVEIPGSYSSFVLSRKLPDNLYWCRTTRLIVKEAFYQIFEGVDNRTLTLKHSCRTHKIIKRLVITWSRGRQLENTHTSPPRWGMCRSTPRTCLSAGFVIVYLGNIVLCWTLLVRRPSRLCIWI